LTAESGHHQRVKSGFREMANAELPRRATDMPKGVLQVIDFIDAKRGQNRLMAINPFTTAFGILTGLKWAV